MKVALLCKSDSTGGAAVVTFRLMNALRRKGIDARMIVTEKKTDSQWVIEAASKNSVRLPFIAERLRIFAANGFNRSTLFQIDTASNGLPLHRTPFIKDADVICLNWVNQGMLSIKGIRKLSLLGKPLIWTMHDMWNMTGICHHAGYCRRFMSQDGECSDCPLLGKEASRNDLSHKTWLRKMILYKNIRIHFVAVSNWLADAARRSSLMKEADISVIPNAFPLSTAPSSPSPQENSSSIPSSISSFFLKEKEPSIHPSLSGIERAIPDLLQEGNDPSLPRSKASRAEASASVKKIIFGAARIDDPIKGHSTLVEATRILAEKYPDEAKGLEIVTFGALKDPEALKNIAIPHTHLGRISPEEIRSVYESGAVVVSTSEWETLPGTLIEGQAWGCVPVALNHGGQADIIDHMHTGYLAEWSDDKKENALRIAEGIIWALENRDAIKTGMHRSVIKKFAEDSVADQYIRMFKKLQDK